jgi:hypothetical protein
MCGKWNNKNNNNNNNKQSTSNMSHKLRLGAIIIIIRNGAKTMIGDLLICIFKMAAQREFGF